MKTTIASAVAVFVLSGAALAQPPGITQEMIARSLPVEGAPLAVAGPYKVTSEPAFGAAGHVVFRPADLSPFPAKDTLPLMVWGNGGCAINSGRYAGFFTTIASHGFLVMSTVAEPGAARRQQNADDMRAEIDWAAKENARDGSPLKGKINLEQVAVMGQSCGGFLSIALGADPRVKTIGVFNSGVQRAAAGAPAGPFPSTDALTKLHGPVLFINGSERDFMMATSLANFEMVNHVPAFYGARHGAGHTATVDHPGGGEFANVASNWMMWTFKKDKKAAATFVGKSCSLCTNANWDTASKGLAE